MITPNIVDLKRVIVDYTKLDESILELIVNTYPDGHTYRDIVAFKNAAGDWVECIEVRDDTTVYLVKLGKRLQDALDDYEEENEDYEDDYNEADDDFDMADEPMNDTDY